MAGFFSPQAGQQGFVPAIKMFLHFKFYHGVISSDFKKLSVMVVSCKHSYRFP